MLDGGRRYRLVALAATRHCLDVYMRHMVALGPVQKAYRQMQPIEITVGALLSLPLYPARIPERPDPLWLGIKLVVLPQAPRSRSYQWT